MTLGDGLDGGGEVGAVEVGEASGLVGVGPALEVLGAGDDFVGDVDAETEWLGVTLMPPVIICVVGIGRFGLPAR